MHEGGAGLHGHHSTIEGGLTKDHLNESSNYLSDDPLLRSNQQLASNNSGKTNTGGAAKGSL